MKDRRENGAGRDNLSEKRGNRSGIRAMRTMLRILGVNRTCEFSWVIALFYVLFDRVARESASHYLRRRFPGDGPWKRFYHTWAFFTSQGQALIEAAAVFEGKMKVVEHGREKLNELLRKPEGLILLCSHFGQWQGMMRVINVRGRPVHVLVRPDRNANVDKFMAIKDVEDKIDVISTESPMGGLLDVYDALIRGDTVCMMGDRCRENESVSLPFFGENAFFPLAAFLMSARTGAPVVPTFAFRSRRHLHLNVCFLDAIVPPETANRPKREMLRPMLEKYVAELERMAKEHPYECFIFENIWRSQSE